MNPFKYFTDKLAGREERKRRNSPEVKRELESYWEGRRLMRVGDGADEWIGMDIASRARSALNKMGYDPDGTRPDLKSIERPRL